MKKLKLILVFFAFFIYLPGISDLLAESATLEKAEDAMKSAARKIENSMEKAIGKVDSLEGEAAKKIEELTEVPEKKPGADTDTPDSREQNKMDEINKEQGQADSAMPEQALYPGVQNIIYRSGQDNEPHAIISYPAFGKEKIDADIKYFVSVLGADYAKDVEESVPAGAEKPASYDQWEMTGFYTLSRPNPDIASITFNIYSYSGGAHGNLLIRCLNYDLKTGKELEFSDLFKDSGKALQILSAYCEQKLRQELGSEVDEDMLRSGTEPDPNNFLNLSLNEKNVVVEFQPYQVGPWSIGPQSVIVPIEELAAASPSAIVWPEVERGK